MINHLQSKKDSSLQLGKTVRLQFDSRSTLINYFVHIRRTWIYSICIHIMMYTDLELNI